MVCLGINFVSVDEVTYPDKTLKDVFCQGLIPHCTGVEFFFVDVLKRLLVYPMFPKTEPMSVGKIPHCTGVEFLLGDMLRLEVTLNCWIKVNNYSS